MTADFTVAVSREISAPAEVLFDAWLEPRSLSAWLRPWVISQTRAEVDARVGGEFRIVMVRDGAEVLHFRPLSGDRPPAPAGVLLEKSPATGHRTRS